MTTGQLMIKLSNSAGADLAYRTSYVEYRKLLKALGKRDWVTFRPAPGVEVSVYYISVDRVEWIAA